MLCGLNTDTYHEKNRIFCLLSFLNIFVKIDNLIIMSYGISIDIIVVYFYELVHPTKISKHFQLYMYHNQ